MPYHSTFMLPAADQQDVDAAWFDRKKQRSVEKNDSRLRRWLIEEVNALSAYHDGHANAEQTAATMTHPISTSPVLDLNSYSNDILALSNLWRLLINALIEWPFSRTHNLFALLEAIAKVPHKIHKGEASDEDGTPWEWSQFPYFSLLWPDHLQPGQICRRCSDEHEVALARRLYLRIKDLEAQLILKHVMSLNKWRIQYIILALEKSITGSDRHIAINDAAAYAQVKLDFHIPAISFLLKYNAREIYERDVHGEIKDLTSAQLWRGKEGDEVAVAARSALESMAVHKDA